MFVVLAICILTDSFNEMASAQNILVNTLEAQVAQRSAQLSGITARNARVPAPASR